MQTKLTLQVRREIGTASRMIYGHFSSISTARSTAVYGNPEARLRTKTASERMSWTP